MRKRHLLAIVPAGLATVAAIGTPNEALAKRMVRSFDLAPPAFQLDGQPVGGSKPGKATPPHLTGSRIAAIGEGALVIDADSGNLVRTDARGKSVAQLAIGKNAGLLAYDPIDRVAYVADRDGSRIAVVSVADKLELTRTIATPAEPFGIALTPDRKSILVTTIADRTLVAYDVAGKERWRTPLDREPRGIAISPDGTRALVAYLATGTVDQIDLVETHKAERIVLSTTRQQVVQQRKSATGESFARAAFAVTYLGDHEAVVPFQRETPIQIAGGGERTGSYGGGFEPPITQQLAFLGDPGTNTRQVAARIAQHQPRALAWDSSRDALYVAGVGTDTILQVRNASQLGVGEGVTATVTTGKDKCGPDGLAVTPKGNVLVWCSFTRNVERVDFVDARGQLAAATKINPGPTLVASAFTDKEHEGLVLFHSAEPRISQQGGLACASCHPDGRADGLSWRIDKHELQTPLLTGRLKDMHPFKWDGTDADLRASMKSTMVRLGGIGLDKDATDALAAYLEQLPAPRTPTRDAKQVARGKDLFDSPDLGCRTCHDGAKYTDQDKHKFNGSTLVEAKTPSLVGLAASAPYYHDGSAPTLEAVLRDRGNVHMADTSKLTDAQVADLTAFLETL
jgi:DNA-binding beta-propeller fold protein YncE